VLNAKACLVATFVPLQLLQDALGSGVINPDTGLVFTLPAPANTS
jgi:hypothetical protein